MEVAGYTKSFRRKWTHHVFRNLRDAAVWSWMTDSAAWKDTKVRFGERVIELKRGQLVTSERFIADGFCMDRQVVRRLWDALEDEQMITREKTHGGTIITICNYDKYQSQTEVENPPANPGQTHVEPTPNPNKNEGNKYNEDKSLNADFDEWYSAYPLRKGRGQALKAYRAARKKAEAASLLAGAKRYAADPKRKPDFTQYPATWLNGEGWLDESAPALAAEQKPDPEKVYQQRVSMVRKGVRSARDPITNDEIAEMLRKSLVTPEEAERYGYLPPDAGLVKFDVRKLVGGIGR